MKTNRKPKLAKSKNHGLMYLAGIVVLGLVVTFLVLRPKPTTAPTVTNTVDPSAATIVTTDNIALSATMKYPAGPGPFPAVVLLHQYGQDRHEWDVYLQKFLDNGMAVLSYDMRGFGESRLAAIPTDQATHLASLIHDVPAVLQYLQQQTNIDRSRISLIGSSVGADVAYLASGSALGIYRTVIISPVVFSTVFDGHDITGFSPNGVYGLASESETAALSGFMKSVKDPQQQKTIPGNAHGLALLSDNDVVASIISWVKP